MIRTLGTGLYPVAGDLQADTREGLRRWDDERRLFREGVASLRHPIDRWGYEEIGEVAELGSAVTKIRPGEIIWGDVGSQEHRSAPRGLGGTTEVASECRSNGRDLHEDRGDRAKRRPRRGRPSRRVRRGLRPGRAGPNRLSAR
jgi:hypothetical protein